MTAFQEWCWCYTRVNARDVSDSARPSGRLVRPLDSPSLLRSLNPAKTNGVRRHGLRRWTRCFHDSLVLSTARAGCFQELLLVDNGPYDARYGSKQTRKTSLLEPL